MSDECIVGKRPLQCVRVLLEFGAGQDDTYNGTSIVPHLASDILEEIMRFNKSHPHGSSKSLRMKIPSHVLDLIAQSKRKAVTDESPYMGEEVRKRRR